ncbi:MAG TPA: hypothetical protein VEQ85_06955 [Lacipirellulaceae bacterium]|nr:hypothetical protein [Lacipirellulaceae bacterium]
MQVSYYGRLSLASLFVLAGVAGCGSKSSPVLDRPDVDAAGVASAIVAQFDGNGDASLDTSELKKCPPLAQFATNYDADKNGALNAEEISARLERLCGSSAAYGSFECAVTLAGRPLTGATVKLRPLEAFKGSLPAAEGTTNDQGVTTPAISSLELPKQLADARLAFPGLYHVEITSPTSTLPARYNTASELGCEFDPSSRGGTSARFDLKSN